MANTNQGKGAGHGAHHCSFCGRNENQAILIPSTTGVYICNFCVEACADLLDEIEPAAEADNSFTADTLPRPTMIKAALDEYVIGQDAAKIALSVARSLSKEYNINPEIFKENDIHIHIPEGATPKDGPSAGITLTTALISLLTDTKVRSDVAMTGEITLRGRVLAIGGLKEKSLAGYMSGIKTLIIPKENEKDIEEIPQEVKDAVEIIPVSNIKQVLDIALVR